MNHLELGLMGTDAQKASKENQGKQILVLSRSRERMKSEERKPKKNNLQP